ncbi:MAG: branched-chain amino acid ABC transporter permease [Acidisphaera sp.]|nr:branched-chain amino acid ABC transporter permease [Acidisphaera sp.]MBV9811448.1 branched-chain amino acid ABC transporter permease [Acetobacteraceae bacterium]
MTGQLALFLAQDGIATGAIYALVALGIVLVFLVTRVIFVPFGDLVAYASLTLAELEAGQRPGTIALVVVLAAIASLYEVASLFRQRASHRVPRALLRFLVLPSIPAALAWALAGRALPDAVWILLTVALVLPLGPLLYRCVFRPVADAPVLVLLILAVVLHFAIAGVALMVFGPESARPHDLTGATFLFGEMIVTGQQALMVGASALTACALSLFFNTTLLGKALRATAVNRVGARLAGIRPATTGTIAFLLAAGLAAVSGILIGPATTLTYDSGFVIGLKAFVGAIVGGLVSYPGAAIGALLVGLLESFTAFWNSAFKEVVVFALLVPILIVRSLLLPGRATDEVEDEL